MASNDLASLRQRAAHDRLSKQKDEIQQTLLNLDQEKADLMKQLADNDLRVARYETQYEQVCEELRTLPRPPKLMVRTPALTPATKPAQPVQHSGINIRVHPGHNPLIRNASAAPNHLEEIHPDYRMVLWESDNPSSSSSVGEWKLFSCSRCSANSMPRDGGTRFFGGTRGMAVHFRKQCSRANEGGMSEKEILRRCFRQVIPTEVAERLRRGEQVPGAVRMVVKAPGLPHHNREERGRQSLGVGARPATLPRWLRLDDGAELDQERRRDSVVGQKRRRTMEEHEADLEASAEDDD